MAAVVGPLDAAEVAAIRQARALYVNAALKQDWDTFLTVYDPQVVILPPEVQPLDTLAKIRAYVEQYPTLITFRVDNIDLDGRVDLAYERGRYDLTGEGFAQQGSHLTLWKKQADGSWKIYRDIWHSDNPA